MAAPYGTSDNPIIEARINGVWTNVSSRVRGEQKVVISRGRASEQARATAGRANLTFDNRDAFFSNRAPQSVNYGLIGKNTQVRVSAGLGDNYLKMLYNDSTDLAGLSTADKAVLDVTGDIDLRAEIDPHTWRPGGSMLIASKYRLTGDQGSWIFSINPSGTLALRWTSTGALAGLLASVSTVAVPVTSGRLAVRATLDVNNGAAGNTVNFYTSDSIGGTWVPLGAAVVKAGTTSIFNSSAGLRMGRGDDNQFLVGGGTGFGGKFYAFQMYNGIAGTLVANVSMTNRGLGDTSWSDGLATPNTWQVAGTGVRITSDRVRMHGELSSLMPDWDKTGTDVTAPAVVSGLIRRLSQGAKPLGSSMLRTFTGYSSYGYWPLEDGGEATQAGSVGTSGRPGTVQACRFGNTPTGLPGASNVLSFTDASSQMMLSLLRTPTETGIASLLFYVRTSATPAAKRVFCTLTTSGTARRIDISVGATAWTIDFYASDGTVLNTANISYGTGTNPSQGWVGYNLVMRQNGTAMDYTQRWDAVGLPGLNFGPTSVASVTVRAITSVKFYSSADTIFNDTQLGHVVISTTAVEATNDAVQASSIAYRGETAAARQSRLAAEEGISFELTGLAANSQTMGYQTSRTLLELFYDCWDADGGLGAEPRDALALAYRTRVDMERRSDCTFDYGLTDFGEVPRPADDDLGLINNATARRLDGSSARYEVTDGINSVLDPPAGAGRYNTDLTFNVADDSPLPSIAGWIALVGSWADDRYPQVVIAMHRARLTGDAALSAAVRALELGDTITLAYLPSWLPPDDVPEIVQGYTETLGKFLWEIRFNGTPGGPYQSVPRLGSDFRVPRLDGTAHDLGSVAGTTDPVILVDTPAGSAVWVDSTFYPAEFPFDIVVDGEVMTVTGITGATSPQLFAVTRSINGIIKSHAAGALVRLARPFFIGR